MEGFHGRIFFTLPTEVPSPPPATNSSSGNVLRRENYQVSRNKQIPQKMLTPYTRCVATHGAPPRP